MSQSELPTRSPAGYEYGPGAPLATRVVSSFSFFSGPWPSQPVARGRVLVPMATTFREEMDEGTPVAVHILWHMMRDLRRFGLIR